MTKRDCETILKEIAVKETRLDDEVRRWYVNDSTLSELGIDEKQLEFVLQSKLNAWTENTFSKKNRLENSVDRMKTMHR